MKNVSMQSLIGKKIIWVNEESADCVFFKTEDDKYYLLDACRTKGVIYGPSLHECNEAEATDMMQDNPY